MIDNQAKDRKIQGKKHRFRFIFSKEFTNKGLFQQAKNYTIWNVKTQSRPTKPGSKSPGFLFNI